ncbi:MAG: cytochrome c, partial [Rhizobiaceae bacterium]|nr:cytochrome c [Rhizobiaceae bacterium]
MRLATFFSATAVLAVIGVGAFVAYAYEPELEALERVDPASFDAALVAEGRQLAAVGNCIACHTLPGGRSFAGGLPLPTPFGIIHSTNITPDPVTGIGAWSQAAFTRSMREGVDREGRHLYPAFPYDHYTRVSDADNRALYAYLMTRRPVVTDEPANGLPFPLNVRMTVAGWKALFFEPGAFQPDPSRSAVLNRGAYLVEGLGHCGGCLVAAVPVSVGVLSTSYGALRDCVGLLGWAMGPR